MPAHHPAHCRELLHDDDTAGLVADSWQRSRRYGLCRDNDELPCSGADGLDDARENNHWAGRIALPLIEPFARRLADRSGIVVFSDARGLVLDTCGSTDFLQRAERMALAPGNLWGEEARGTNAIGTALALNQGCEVLGSEHFLLRNAGLYCAAAPVNDPFGRQAGVIDVSSPANVPLRHAVRWLDRLVRTIEHQWTLASATPQQSVLQLQRPGAHGHPALVMVFEDDVLQSASRAAMVAFGLTARHVGQIRLDALLPTGPDGALPVSVMAANQQRYIIHRAMPAQKIITFSHKSIPAPQIRAPGTDDDVRIDTAKALRIINAGIALCVTGETGCGKELLSQQLHSLSRWKKGKFVAINCAALPENLIESELFGYVPGAFTGASQKGYTGKFREADGGVLFLDEIGDMPLALQTRLLRVLQEKKVTPLGGNTVYPVEFALVCATHQDLVQRVQQGVFREDLFYRIQEFHLRIPPLRQWPHIDRFILRLWHELGGVARQIALTHEVVSHLAGCRWPGNVRQLISQLRVLLALTDDGQRITLADLPEGCFPERVLDAVSLPDEPAVPHADTNALNAIHAARGNMSEAAKQLGISRSTLYRRLSKQHHL